MKIVLISKYYRLRTNAKGTLVELQGIGGEYSEAGTWWDASGQSGGLGGSVTIESTDNRLKFLYGGGELQITETLAGGARSAAIQGQNSTGFLFIGDDCLILEYTMDLEGHEETNTDIWMFYRGLIRRSGVIRQSDRTIWFEAGMSRV